MAYKKRRGILTCFVVGYSPFWMDVVNAKSGAECCVFLKHKMSEKMKAALDSSIATPQRQHMIVARMPGEDLHYKFMGFSGGSHMGRQKLVEKEIAYEALEREVNVDYNPARSRGNKQSLVVGRAGLPTSQRTGDKISRALSNRIDNSKELKERCGRGSKS